MSLKESNVYCIFDYLKFTQHIHVSLAPKDCDALCYSHLDGLHLNSYIGFA